LAIKCFSFVKEKTETFELQANGRDGRPRWVRLDGLYDHDPPQHPQSRTTLMNIKGQKQTLQKLTHLAAIVRSSNDAIIRQDPEGVITHWNPAAEKIFGYSTAEAVGRPIELIIPRDRAGEGHSLIRRVRGGEMIVGWETVRRSKDGRKINIALTLSAIHDDQGRFTAVTSIERDITEHITIRHRLNHIRDELELATSAARIGTWFADIGRKTAQWNNQLYRLLGLDPRPGPENMEFFFSFIHPDDRGQLENIQTVINKGGDEIKEEFRIIRKDGRIRWLAARGRIMRNASGEPVHMAGINFDITEVRQAKESEKLAQMQLAVKVAQLEQKNQELEQFAYAASHDLKTPLRAIRNYSEFLYKDLAEGLSGEQKSYLDGLKIAADQGLTLIDDLLVYSRIGRTSIEAERIDMSAMMDEVKSFLNLPPDIDLTVAKDWPVFETDPMLLSLILKNLVANAAKFNQRSSKRIDIGWTQPDKKGCIELFVRDNGVGIDPKYQEQVFRIFRRLHSTMEFEGTGIGLAIVQKAAFELGGSVRVESAPGEGSTFYVKIPAKVEEGSEAQG
jgi:PAS domain S-box-containing protein